MTHTDDCHNYIVGRHTPWHIWNRYIRGSLPGQPAEACYVLAAGKVVLSYHPSTGAQDTRQETTLRQFDDPGRLLGWSALVQPRLYTATLTALEPACFFVLDREPLDDHIEADPQFGVALMERIIWVLGNRLRETHIRLMARRYDEEVLAIQTLLDQSSAMLPVDSPLHKVPYCLKNRLTIADAFQALETAGHEHVCCTLNSGSRGLRNVGYRR